MRWLAYISFSLYFNNDMCHIGKLLLNILPQRKVIHPYHLLRHELQIWRELLERVQRHPVGNGNR